MITPKQKIDKRWTGKIEPYNLSYSLPVLLDESEENYYYISPVAEGLEPPIIQVQKEKPFIEQIKISGYEYTQEDKDYILQFKND